MNPKDRELELYNRIEKLEEIVAYYEYALECAVQACKDFRVQELKMSASQALQHGANLKEELK